MEKSPVTVAFSIEGSVLTARFEVAAKSIFGKKQLEKKEYPFDFDVVEVFVTPFAGDHPKYFEFEVTPYNQGLQVNVTEPRQEYYFGVKNGYEHSATLTAKGWEAEMKIPLKTLGWDGKEPCCLHGNAYAALGQGDKRVYWSLFELPPGKPDFHVPGAFQTLIEIPHVRSR